MFNFREFIAELEYEQKKLEYEQKSGIQIDRVKTYQEFKKLFPEMLELPLEEQNWYKEYIKSFSVVKYITPIDLKDKNGWDILLQLCAGSFSTDVILEKEDKRELPDLVIAVKSKDIITVRRISQLSKFQIQNLFKIFISEQMRLQILLTTAEKEKNAIINSRDTRISRWHLVLEYNAEIISNFYGQNILEEQNALDGSSVSNKIRMKNNKDGYLFNFHTFVNELKENPEQKEVVSKFERFYPKMLEKTLSEQNWMKKYIAKFTDKPDIAIPKEIEKNDFDWGLLQGLVAGSFSSMLEYGNKKKGKYELEIHVESGNQTVVKKISELWGFQILKLYEIYVLEQMNLQILIAEDPREAEAILVQRQVMLKLWTRHKTKLKLRELELI